MTYTINGKKYNEFDINKRCAELMEITVLDRHPMALGSYLLLECGFSDYNPCSNPEDTWPIIEKCWDELNESILRNGGRRKSHWQDMMQQHNCTNLIAACICFIESKEEV
tara:strand:- start:404 stop:733 length:330 start_codon:yes stop_codon:yes gene_type:complete